MFRGMTLAAALAVLLAPPARAQETYEIKVRKPAAGASALVERSEVSGQHIKILDDKQTVLSEEKKSEKKQFVYRATVLEVKGEDVLKAKREYRKASVTDGSETKSLGLEGKTILIEKKGEKFEFKVEGGGELSEEARKTLDAELNKKDKSNIDFEKLAFPGKPVKVGEQWQIGGDAIKTLAKDMKIDLDLEKSKASGKLLKAYKKDGKQFGVIELDFHFAPTAIAEEGNKMPLQAGSLFRITAVADACIDGTTSTSDAKVNIAADVRAVVPLPNGMNATLTVNVQGTMNDKTTEEK